LHDAAQFDIRLNENGGCAVNRADDVTMIVDNGNRLPLIHQ
jgi:hypothetical protein